MMAKKESTAHAVACISGQEPIIEAHYRKKTDFSLATTDIKWTLFQWSSLSMRWKIQLNYNNYEMTNQEHIFLLDDERSSPVFLVEEKPSSFSLAAKTLRIVGHVLYKM